MIDTTQLERIRDCDVIGSDGQKIGSVDDVYVDDVTGEPTFALVNTGLFGMKSSFIPIREADLRDDGLHIAYSKDKVKDAPSMEKDSHLEPSEEQELYRFYGLEGDTSLDATRTAPTTAPRADMGDAGRVDAGTDDAMTRSEEELRVGTREKEVGKVRLRKYVTTEHVTKTVPVRKEEVRLEREPITDGNVDEALDGPAISEDEHEVTLHEEEPVVEKRAVPKERVRLETETHTDQQTVEGDVAKEEIDLKGLEDSREGQERR